MRRALVCGGGGFIGAHLARRLASEGAWVRVVDLHEPPHAPTAAHELMVGDLRDPATCVQAVDGGFDEVYQLAADMGGAGYILTEGNDADIVHNSALINLNMLRACQRGDVRRVFFSSSACVYPERNQEDPDNPVCTESSTYPAEPDSEYGWEKLFAERLYATFARCSDLEVRIARFHNIFGPECTWQGGREKAPAALCRKVAQAPDGTSIEIWGDGLQTRSFLHIAEALEGVLRLMRSDVTEPLNIGSEECVTILDLAERIIRISGKRLTVTTTPGPQGVRGRTSDNRLIAKRLGWAPSRALDEGLENLYGWIARAAQGAQAVAPN